MKTIALSYEIKPDLKNANKKSSKIFNGSGTLFCLTEVRNVERSPHVLDFDSLELYSFYYNSAVSRIV